MKNVMLGTAMWGWSINRDSAFRILDAFYNSGGRKIDTANNYPINGVPENYQFAIKLISEWVKLNKVRDLNVTLKVGSVTNEKSDLNDLSFNYLKDQHVMFTELLDGGLKCFMIHWDNRFLKEQIESSLEILPILRREGQTLGISGIKHPELYAALLANYDDVIEVQVKQNFLNNGLQHYKNFSESKYQFWAYGIACSGLKLNKSEYHANSYVSLARQKGFHDSMLTDEHVKKINNVFDALPFIRNLYHLGVVVSELNESLEGYIIAPSSVEQLKDIIKLKEQLKNVQLEKEAFNEFTFGF